MYWTWGVEAAFCQRYVASSGNFIHSSPRPLQSLARLGARTTAIDASESNIAIASLHAAADPRLGSDALTYRHAPAESLLSEPKRFDVVCSMEVVEHVDNPAAFLESCASLVKVYQLTDLPNAEY